MPGWIIPTPTPFVSPLPDVTAVNEIELFGVGFGLVHFSIIAAIGLAVFFSWRRKPNETD